VKEDGIALALPAIQAILRSQIVLAAKGNVQAQRAVLAAIRTIEQENVEAAAVAAQNAPKEMNHTEAARRVAFLLRLGEEEQKLKSEEEKRAAAAAPSGTGEAPGAAPRAPRIDAGAR
jgi:acyl-CoA reductase-like NAD-dependent aldehyde dehydrogenase